MRRSSLGRLFATLLCLMLMINIVAMPAAMAESVKTIKQSKATFSCVTLNNNVKWLLGRTSKVTITNHSDDPLYVTIKEVDDCKVYTYRATIYAGNSVTIKVKTNFGNSGSFQINLSNAYGHPIKYSMSSSGIESIIRTK